MIALTGYTKLELETLYNYRTGLLSKQESQKILKLIYQKESEENRPKDMTPQYEEETKTKNSQY